MIPLHRVDMGIYFSRLKVEVGKLIKKYKYKRPSDAPVASQAVSVASSGVAGPSGARGAGRSRAARRGARGGRPTTSRPQPSRPGLRAR